MKYVKTKADMPQDPHLAVLVFSSRHVLGDKRSRTNPGHGYPAHNVPVIEYIAFGNESDLVQWIEENGDRKPFRVINVTPKKVSTSLNVTLS